MTKSGRDWDLQTSKVIYILSLFRDDISILISLLLAGDNGFLMYVAIELRQISPPIPIYLGTPSLIASHFCPMMSSVPHIRNDLPVQPFFFHEGLAHL